MLVDTESVRVGIRHESRLVLRLFKDAEGNILSDETCILSRWREYFEDLLNLVKANYLDPHEVIQPGEIESFAAAEVSTAI